MPADDRILRDQLVEFLRGGSAHADLATALDDFPAADYGKRPQGSPHSAWQLLEHIRFTLHDLLVFSTDSNYLAPKWPDDYWLSEEAPDSPADWKKSVKGLKSDLSEFEKFLKNPDANLYARIPWGDGQSLLREVLLAIDHTSYHLGQLVMLRKQLGDWKA
jgi:uncharacterized damage-inducible protein DinB